MKKFFLFSFCFIHFLFSYSSFSQCYSVHNFEDYRYYAEATPERFIKEVASHYGVDTKRVEALAFDPDHGKITSGSILEAVTALELEKSYFFSGCFFQRGGKGIEYIDCNGNFWDVKTPPSLSGFDNMKEAGQSVIDKVRKIYNGSFIGVILDISYLTPSDYFNLSQHLAKNLSDQEKNRIIEVCHSFNL